jgi:dephospho-CoA kinase
VIREFGPGILGPDGRINRLALGRMVFAEPGRLMALNALTHPVILRRIADWLETRPATCREAVVIIPLLYEIGAEKSWDKVVCVGAPEPDQLRRLEERGLTPEEASARIAAQVGLAVKMERADFVIYNCGSKTMLEEQAKQVMRAIRGE